MGGFVTTRADWGAMLDAIYAEVADDQQWAELVHQAAKHVFRSSHGAGFSIVRHSPSCTTGRFEALAMDTIAREAFRMSDPVLDHLGVEGFRRYFYPSGLMATHLEIERGMPAEVVRLGREMRAERGIGDAIGVFSYPEPGRVATLYAMHEGPIVLSITSASSSRASRSTSTRRCACARRPNACAPSWTQPASYFIARATIRGSRRSASASRACRHPRRSSSSGLRSSLASFRSSAVAKAARPSISSSRIHPCNAASVRSATARRRPSPRPRAVYRRSS